MTKHTINFERGLNAPDKEKFCWNRHQFPANARSRTFTDSRDSEGEPDASICRDQFKDWPELSSEASSTEEIATHLL
jgi:hypothetical protein